MRKRPDYEYIRIVLQHGHVKSFKELSTYVDLPQLFADAGLDPYKSLKKLEDPMLFKVGAISSLADILGLQMYEVVELMLKEKDVLP